MPDRRRRTRHPAGVRTGVALADPLVVLGERQGRGRRAVAQRKQRTFGAGDALFQHERTELGRRADGGLGLVGVGGHGDALAGGQPVELHHDRAPELAPPGDRPVGVLLLEALVRRSGHAEGVGEMA
ncbi:MAG: hypothetical protein R2697_22030 [Ilumatobacteraceae bacterium]